MTSQKELFLNNWALQTPEVLTRIVEIEKPWIEACVMALDDSDEKVESFAAYKTKLQALLQEDEMNTPPSMTYLAEDATREEFRFIISQFAVDSLTEAQSFWPIIPRLPYRAQMPVMQILIDEFGCGNLGQMHSNIYCELLAELELPTALEPHVEVACDEVFKYVNIFHWMTKRAESFEYFLGGLAWFESVVPWFFSFYMTACKRLIVASSKYFSEHIHIDEFHARYALLSLREAEAEVPVDYTKAWIGSKVAWQLASEAFDKVCDLAKKPEVAEC